MDIYAFLQLWRQNEAIFGVFFTHGVDNAIRVQCVFRGTSAAAALLPELTIRQYARVRAPRIYRRALSRKIFDRSQGGIFSVSRPEDAGILAYFKDDNDESGKIRPPAAHCILIVLSIRRK